MDPNGELKMTRTGSEDAPKSLAKHIRSLIRLECAAEHSRLGLVAPEFLESDEFSRLAASAESFRRCINGAASYGLEAMVYIPNLDSFSALIDRLVIESIKHYQIVSGGLLGAPRLDAGGAVAATLEALESHLTELLVSVASTGVYHFISEARTYAAVSTDGLSDGTTGLPSLVRELTKACIQICYLDHLKLDIATLVDPSDSAAPLADAVLHTRTFLETRASSKVLLDRCLCALTQSQPTQ